MDLKEKLKNIIDNNDIEELKIFLKKEYTDVYLVNLSLQYACLYGKIDMIKYILINYSNNLRSYYIKDSLENIAIYDYQNIIKHLKLYMFIRESNLHIVKYKNAIFLS